MGSVRWRDCRGRHLGGLLLERLERVDATWSAVDLLGPTVRPIGPELPGPAIVGEHDLERRLNAGSTLWILDRNDSLHAPIQVALHQVCRSAVQLRHAAIGNSEH